MAQNLKVRRFQFQFTRPNDTTAYAAQDSVSNSTTAPTIITWLPKSGDGLTQAGLKNGASYQIKSAKLTKSNSGTTNASFDLYFYTSGVTATNDNAANPILYSNKESRIGKVSFTLITEGTGSDCAEQVNTDVNHTFVATNTTIYSKLLATAAYTPIAVENFYGEIELIEINE